MNSIARTLSLIAMVAGGFVVACDSPNVIPSEPASGGSRGAGGGGGNTGQVAPPPGAPSIPDAAPMSSDTATPATPMTCAEDAYKAEAVPLDLLLLVDTSSSMNQSAGMSTKWQIAQKALSAFVRDPRSAGLGLGLQYFPYQRLCMADSECGGLMICRGRSRCAAAGTTTPTGRACGSGVLGINFCPVGTTCMAVGTCSDSLADCTNIGQPCEGGGGTCSASPKTCANTGGGCDAANYEIPAVKIAALPGAASELLSSLHGRSPEGTTPLRPAVEGALTQLRLHLEKTPGRKGVLVLVSDGLPSGCSQATNTIAALSGVVAMAAAGTPAITTYVIGAFAPNEIAMAQPQLDLVAMSGGTGRAFVLSATDDLTAKLQEALDTIRGAALSCEFKIPPPKTGSIDFSRVNVRYTPTSGTREDVVYVKTADKCDPMRGGWFYDVDPAAGTPTRVMVCPSTCEGFKKDQTAKVDLVYGCATKTID